MKVINVNRKGFMFIETIVMCAILMIGLLIIYNRYTSSIAREKERMNYESDISDNYKLYYFKTYLKNNNRDLWICTDEDNCPIDEKFIAENIDYIDFMDNQIIADLGIDEKIFDAFDIEKLYLIKCDLTLNQNDSFYEYQKIIKDDCEKYRFIAEFYNEKTKKYSYTNMIYPLESD